MRVGVIGINYRLADLKLREMFAKVCHLRFKPSAMTHFDHPLVTLSTCNRMEVYFSSEVLAETHSYLLNVLRDNLEEAPETFDQKLYSYFGIDCFQHLSRVTAGLDSAIVAETEIQGQVKAAYEESATHLSLPSELHFIFQKALTIGKRIRNELPMGRGMPDIEHAILATGTGLFPHAQNAKILFIGASDINTKIISFLISKNIRNITICNRTYSSAQEVAKKYSIATLNWENVFHWHTYDWIIFGTKATDRLITKKNLPHLTEQKLIIDLSVPMNVDPALGKEQAITLLNIDEINHLLESRRQKMATILEQAEAFVDNATRRQIDLFQEKAEKRAALFLACG